MFCSQCGKEIDTDSAFCRYCGKQVPPLPEPAAGIVNNASPKVIPATARPGQGIEHYVLDGIWEATAKTSGGNLHLRFSVNHHEPFSGWWELKGRFGKLITKSEIIGNCHLVMDGKILLGLHLEGLKDQSESFDLLIPIHTRAGSLFIGITEDGETWSSQNIQPVPD